MYKQLLSCLLALLFLSVSVFGAFAGKMGGISDNQTNIPLPDANVMIIGTTMRATTNITGEFIILNVPIGADTIKSSFVGNSDVHIGGAGVSAAFTGEITLARPCEAFEGQEFTIVAEWSLVDKNATSKNYAIDTRENVIHPLHTVVSTLDASNVIIDTLSLRMQSVAGRIPTLCPAGWIFKDNFDLFINPFQLKFGDSYNTRRDQSGSTEPASLLILPARNYLYEYGNYSTYFSLSPFIHPITLYTLSLNYIHNQTVAFTAPLCDWTPNDWPKWDSPALNPILPGSACHCDFNVLCLFTIGFQNAPVLFVNS